MFDRLASVRVPVFIAVALSAVLALAASYVMISRLSKAQDRVKTIREDSAVAAVLAQEAAKSDSFSEIQRSSSLLLKEENQRAIMTINGVSRAYGAPLVRGEAETTVRRTFPGGSITVMSKLDSAPDLPFEFVAFSTGVLAVVLGAAVLVNVASTREVRRRVDQAVIAADRVAAGDFSARMGPAGPGVLAKFGAAFDSMAGRLEESERDQRRFLADVAHEIATPLNAVAGFALAVVDGTIEKDKAAGLIASQTARVSELLDDLTQLRTLDASDAEGEPPELLDLAELGADLVDAFHQAAEEAGVSLRARGRKVEVVAYARLVETVARNLVTNAIRYTPRGGHIEIGCHSMGQKGAVLYVRDTGIGISPEHQARVFDRFYRVNEARDRESGGSGLGLAIAKRAAEAMGGHLELQSAAGEGSEFRLLLPLHPVPPAESAVESSEGDLVMSDQPGE